ncbi:BTB/POZ domain-containing protein KCTD21 [Acropora cervicornis]|uniref:BTB/POZ domain-containing protein KCTD21 n=1 Tax=Acropora cervicornis TaxID=6130 RepID=A0AAD9VD11_ACRCE|nr:BTB/POZ domain-containing protein KCTD21 [Acropora cervicornis]
MAQEKIKESNAEPDIYSEVEEHLAKINLHLKEVCDIVKRETSRLRKEKEAFGSLAKKLEHVHFSNTLKLNIGGQLFTTSLETMKKDPGSMFHAMFSERFDTKPAEDGSYFIDRDATHFRVILQYLRTGELVVPDDKIIRKELLTEAEFYQIQGMIDELRSHPFEESNILSSAQRNTLIDWLKPLWPAVYKEDPNSFLFSLSNPSGLNSKKMSLLPRKMNQAICCCSTYGPSFGAGPDLQIPSNPNNSNTCCAWLSNSYQLPAGQKASIFLTGNETFNLTELEIKEPNEELVIDVEDEEDLAEINDHIKEVFRLLKRKTSRLRKEKEAFASVAKKLEHVHFSKTLKLNIGGQLFTTSLETMRNDAGSMFHAMFSGRFDTKPAEDGSYFIDRDGTHFRYILNYFRTAQLVVPEDKIVRKELLNEAEFYQVEGIIDILRSHPFEESNILSRAQRHTLIDWLKGSLTSASHNYVLIYRASRDGWAASSFHQRCDLKGPTVTVARTLPTADYKRDPNAFLFSLSNPSGLNSTKMSLLPEKMDQAIHCCSNYGPTFGAGPDLRIANNPNSNSACSARLSNCYQLPAGQKANTFFTGAETFNLTELEVFSFEK